MNGLYGEAQGDENRGVQRGAAETLLGERIADNAIAEGEAVAELATWWDCWLGDSFEACYDRIRAAGIAAGREWYGLEPGDTPTKDYRKWESAFVKRLQSIITRATFGLPVALKAQGQTFADGANIPSPNTPPANELEALLAQP